jgi:hypothetical protein
LKRAIAILLILGCASLVSCKAFQKHSSFDDIKIGMSFEEVKKIMGYPVSQFNGHTELATWNADSYDNQRGRLSQEGGVMNLGQLIELSWLYKSTRIDTIQTPKSIWDVPSHYSTEGDRKTDSLLEIACRDAFLHRYAVIYSKAIIFDRASGTVSTVIDLPIAAVEIKSDSGNYIK